MGEPHPYMEDPHPWFYFLMLIKLVSPAVIGGYLLGSIPFGLILTKLAGMGDIRAIGSGNIGATNVLRTGKKGLAALTLLLDGGKGAVAVLLSVAFLPLYIDWLLGNSPNPIREPDIAVAASFAGVAAVVGHIFPVWLRFKGGKGVATALGVFTALAWPVGLACMMTWLIVATLFRISSLSALLAMALAPAFVCIWSQDQVPTARWIYVISTAIIAAIVIAKHHANIRRLIRGEEPRIGRSI